MTFKDRIKALGYLQEPVIHHFRDLVGHLNLLKNVKLRTVKAL